MIAPRKWRYFWPVLGTIIIAAAFGIILLCELIALSHAPVTP